MMKKYLMALVIALSLFVLIGCKKKEESIIQFINSSHTTLDYVLTDDNINPKITYDRYQKITYDDGYDYVTNDNSELYRFSNVEGYQFPIMSYVKTVNNGSNYNYLFGVKLGTSAIVHKNPVLGVNKTMSLIDYFLDLGFKNNFDREYINQGYISANNEYINWHYFIKDNIFINIALGTNDDLKLESFEIGLNVNEVKDKLIIEKNGYNLVINEGLSYIYNNEVIDRKYVAGNLISLKLYKGNFDSNPKLYINNTYIKDFVSAKKDYIYYYKVIFVMPNNNVIIDVRS